MRKCFAVLAILLAACLSGCLLAVIDRPREVRVDRQVYQSGFYGDLWPDELSYQQEEYEVGGKTFRKLEDSQFDCVHTYHIGSKSEGMVFCLKSQWEKAQAYYADAENFNYYCRTDMRWPERRKDHEIKEINLEKFEEITHLGDTYGLNLFDPVKNKAGALKAVELDPSKHKVSNYFTFYKQSKDGLFVSFRGNKFFLCEDKLYLARTQNGTTNIITAVEIPQETASYFIELVKKFQKEES
ncbi:MAG: hypothetical protein HFG20_10625 [Anaerotruncus sp.]|nr:hypothetical protein [Anaerotruncus sp.]